jgi:hypothetical protein
MSDARHAPPPRERWLRVVRDDEPPPPPPPDEPTPSPPPPPAPRVPKPLPGPDPAPAVNVAGSRPTTPGRAGPRWAGLRRAGVVGDITELIVLVVVGATVALAVDGFVGPLDGRPPVHAFLVLALPFWDRLPRRIPVRLAEIAIMLAAVGAVWLGLSALRPQSWWRAEIACGLACALVGAARILLAATLAGRRTVKR